MKYFIGFLAMTFVISGILLILIEFNQRIPKYPEPERVVLYDDRKCLVYKGQRHGAPLYALICEDGSVVFTTNYLFIRETKE